MVQQTSIILLKMLQKTTIPHWYILYCIYNVQREFILMHYFMIILALIYFKCINYKSDYNSGCYYYVFDEILQIIYQSFIREISPLAYFFNGVVQY